MGSGLAVSVFLAAAMSAASLPPPAAASAFSSFTVGDLAAAGEDVRGGSTRGSTPFLTFLNHFNKKILLIF